LWHPYLGPVSIESPYVARANRDDAEPLVPPGPAPRRSVVCAGEEAAHCMSEVTESLLLDHLRAIPQPGARGAGGGELTALLQVARGGPAAGTPPRLLLDGEVPYEPGVRAMPEQDGLLFGRRLKTIPRHVNMISKVLIQGWVFMCTYSGPLVDRFS